MRVCRPALWNVSPTWTGWPEVVCLVFRNQPVGTDEARAEALARARDVPRFIDTEIANQRDGLRLGHRAPRSGVEAVIALVETLVAAPPAESPFYDPATRDDDEEFAAELLAVVEGDIAPATRRPPRARRSG
jgi:uncharacterized protein (DUF885 family)